MYIMNQPFPALNAYDLFCLAWLSYLSYSRPLTFILSLKGRGMVGCSKLATLFQISAFP
jgi:hypothetical protein